MDKYVFSTYAVSPAGRDFEWVCGYKPHWNNVLQCLNFFFKLKAIDETVPRVLLNKKAGDNFNFHPRLIQLSFCSHYPITQHCRSMKQTVAELDDLRGALGIQSHFQILLRALSRSQRGKRQVHASSKWQEDQVRSGDVKSAHPTILSITIFSIKLQLLM